MLYDNNQQLANLLVQNELLSQEHLQKLLEQAQKQQKSLQEVMVEQKIFSTEELLLLEKILSLSEENSQNVILNKYQLLGEIGKGGMGHVFKAKCLQTNEIVAVKLLSPELSRQEEFVARFYREFEAASKLQHPNIVKTLDTGEENQTHFLVMEYVQGNSLKKILDQKQKLTEEETIPLICQLLDALEYLHQRKLIHRDIKPDNLLITPSGNLKLIDMGLIRNMELTSLTLTGAIIGTPHYLSPEQAKGEKKLDIRSDIYAVGATMYYMLTGTPPFHSDHPLEVISAHVHQPVPNPLQYTPELSQPIVATLYWTLEKSKELRPSSPAVLKNTLEAILNDKSNYPPPLTQYLQQIQNRTPPTLLTPLTSEETHSSYLPAPKKSKVKQILATFALLFVVATSLYLWNFQRHNLFSSPSPQLPPSEQQAQKLLEKAQNSLKEQNLEEAFFAFRTLFSKYQHTQTFQQHKPFIQNKTKKMFAYLIQDLPSLDLSKLLKFYGHIKKDPNSGQYLLTYKFQPNHPWQNDWEVLQLKSTQKLVHTTPQKEQAFECKLKFQRIQQITLHFSPLQEGYLALSIGKTHLLLNGTKQKWRLWHGVFSPNPKKFRTVGYLSFKKPKTASNLDPLPPLTSTKEAPYISSKQGKEKLTLTFQANVSLKNQFPYRAKAILNNYAFSQLEIPIPYEQSPQIILRFSENVHIEKLKIKGDFQTNWLKNIFSNIQKKWFSHNPS